ncbi:MAG: hypothetical protein WBN60_05335 [Polyangiales bacterium]
MTPVHVCRRITDFYDDVPNASDRIGMCVDPLVFPGTYLGIRFVEESVLGQVA